MTGCAPGLALTERLKATRKWAIHFLQGTVPAVAVVIREFKKLRRRRREEGRLKNEFIFYLRISRHSEVIYFITVKTTTKRNLGHSDKFEIEILKISHRGSRFSDNAEFSHFTLLFCRGRQRNVPKLITHVHSYCSAH